MYMQNILSEFGGVSDGTVNSIQLASDFVLCMQGYLFKP